MLLHIFPAFVHGEDGILLSGVTLTMLLELSQQERILLFKQDPATKSKGGFQALIVNLQTLMDNSGRLLLTNQLIEKIRRYAFSYGNGGWENILVSIFGRVMGSNLNSIN